jgi:1,4-alpha-glucan branching enzyme
VSFNGGALAVEGSGGGAVRAQDADWSALAAPGESRYWKRFGAHAQADGVRFSVRAPNAQQVNGLLPLWRA